MIMRTLLAVTLSLPMANCSAESYNPEAALKIPVSAEDQVRVIEASKDFGERNGFQVLASNDMPKQGRLVSELLLKRADGVMVTIDNFLREDELHVFFFAKKPEADWQSIKATWLDVVSNALDGHGEITEVPVGPPPDYTKLKQP